MTYTKRRDRIVKPPSRAQRENAKKFVEFKVQPTTSQANPTSSWWVGKDRAALRRAIADEQRRISWSRCGLSMDLTQGL